MAETSLDALFKLLNKGQTTTQSGGTTTTTEQTMLSSDAVSALMRQALEGNSGLSQLLSGQASAGLYNSSTNQLLVNDLMARISTNIAAQTAPKVSTRTAPPTTTRVGRQSMTGNDYVGLLMGMGGKQYLDKFLKNKTPVESAVDWVTEVFGGSGTPAVSGGVGGGGGVSGVNTSTDMNTSVMSAISSDLGSPAAYTFSAAESAAAPAISESSDSFVGPPSYLAETTAAPEYTYTAAESAAAPAVTEGSADFVGPSQSTSGSSSSSGSWLGAITGAMGGYSTGKRYAETEPEMSSGEDGFGTYHHDARTEIGGGILGGVMGYWGGAAGSAAAPAVTDWIHPYAQDMTRDVIMAGDEIGGVTGAMVVDPIGAMASGKYSNEEIAASGIASGLGPLAEDAVDPIIENIVTPVQEFFDKNCFITTAVCTQLNKSDSCEELIAMRKLRDEYALTKGYEHEVAQYYKFAPKIVENINKTSEAVRVYTDFYNLYIVPAVAAVASGNYKEAHGIYRDLFNYAASVAGVEVSNG